MSGVPHMGVSGISQVPRQSILRLCDDPRPRTTPSASPMTAGRVLPPGPTHRRRHHEHDIGAKPVALSPAVYASRPSLPRAMQDSLPADGLRLCRAGVEPAELLRMVSGLRSPPFPSLPPVPGLSWRKLGARAPQAEGSRLRPRWVRNRCRKPSPHRRILCDRGRYPRHLARPAPVRPSEIRGVNAALHPEASRKTLPPSGPRLGIGSPANPS